MTTIVFSEGMLAADSRITSNGSSRKTDNRVVKLYKLTDITYEGVEVPWMGCCGSSSQIDSLRTLLKENPGELTDLIKQINRYLIAPANIGAYFLLENGHGVMLDVSHGSRPGFRLLPYRKESTLKCAAIGSGNKNIDLVYRLGVTDARVACTVLAKLDKSSGGRILFVKPDSRDVRVYRGLPKQTKEKLMSDFESILDSKE